MLWASFILKRVFFLKILKKFNISLTKQNWFWCNKRLWIKCYGNEFEKLLYESCLVESSASVTLLYISNHLSQKPRSALCTYKSMESESTFIKLLIPKKANIIVGYIYCHFHMALNKFSDYYLNDLLDMSSKENKTYSFYVDLMKYDHTN